MAHGYINDRTTDYSGLKSRLMGSAPSRQRSDHFDVLNRHLRPGLVMPGQLVIVPDPYSVTCSMEEAWLVRRAEAIRRELDAGAGPQVVNNYDLLQSFLGYGSLGVGSATSAWARHLDEVAQTLEAIEQLHQRLKNTGLDREAFLRQRKALFGLLDTQLQGAARFAGQSGSEEGVGDFYQKLSAKGRDRRVCAADAGYCANVEVVGQGRVCGVGTGRGRGWAGNQGGVCGGAGGAVSAGEICGDGEIDGRGGGGLWRREAGFNSSP